MYRVQRLPVTLDNRPLLALIVADGVSRLGDWLYLTALPVLVFQRTGDPALVGLAAAGRLIPFLLLSMPAGVIADRVSGLSVLRVTESTRCAAMVFLALLCAMRADVMAILLVAMIAAAAGTIAMPALGSLVPSMSRSDGELGRANALSSTLEGLATIAGPAVAGLLIFTGGLPIAFLLNGGSFAIVAVTVWALRPAREGRHPTPRWQETADAAASAGWVGLARRLARQLVLDGAISFASSAVTVLTVVVAVDLLRAGDAFAGLLNAAAGAGGIAGALFAARVVTRHSRRGTMTGVVVGSLGLLAVALAASPAVALGGMAGAFGALVLLDTINLTEVQRLTRDGSTGRALGLLHTLAAGWMMAGALLPTLVAATMGVRAALLVVGAAIAVLGFAALLPGTESAANSDEEPRPALLTAS